MAMEISGSSAGNPQAHVAVVPTPGMGHLIPLGELAKRLVHGEQQLSITFINFAESASRAQQSFLDSLPPSISSLTLPPVDLSDLPSSAKIETRMSVTAARSVPAITSVLRQLKSSGHHLVALIADLFATDTFDAATQVGVPSYLFYPTNLLTLSVMLHAPALDKEFSCEYHQLPSPVRLPGCVPIPGKDILAPLQDKKDDAYSWTLHQGRRYREATAILVNTFEELEPETATVLSRVEEGRPPVYSVGPLIRTPGMKNSSTISRAVNYKCLAWLDEQPRGSVLYVSFGSGGTLSTEQTRELALGLEMSGQRFLWVVRSPSDHEANANYFSVESNDNEPVEYLPAGFVERTKERGLGLVEPGWAPQIEVLGHESTGGFLTHCGWNSTLESVVKGVPMIAWPLFAEQKQNAVMLVEDAKVALRIICKTRARASASATDDDHHDHIFATKEEISTTVRELMEGEEGEKVRKKVKYLQEAGDKALQEPEGNSYKALAQIVTTWKKHHAPTINDAL